MICSIQMNAQVLTRHLAPDQNSEEYIYFPVEYDINYLLQPEVDFDQVREEDIASGNPLYRFAVKVDQHYTQEDGTWLVVHSFNIRQNKIEVDMTRDVPGVYFVQVMNKYQITSQKLIKL